MLFKQNVYSSNYSDLEREFASHAEPSRLPEACGSCLLPHEALSTAPQWNHARSVTFRPFYPMCVS